MDSADPRTRRAPGGLDQDAPASAADGAYRHIRRAVLEGRYVPGQRLFESDLIAELGLSRGPIREAMNKLSGDGIVRIEPRRGYVIPRLSPEEIGEIYQMLEALHGLAARLAAERVDQTEPREAVARALQGLDDLKEGGLMAFMAAVDAISGAVIAASGNRRLEAVIGQLRTNTHRLQVRALIDLGRIDHALERHREIAQAVLAGDADHAETLMRAYVRESGRMFQEAARR